MATINLNCVEVDGVETTYTSLVALSSYFVFQSQNPYSKEEDVFCRFNVSHPLDNTNEIAAFGVVEDVIVLPTAPVLVPKPTNVTMTYTLEAHIGTNVTYKWDFGNGDILWSNGTFDQLTMDYEYAAYGNYTITVYMWNQVSNSTMDFPVTVQDTLFGLEFTAEKFDSGFMQATNISFSLKVGTAVSIFIDYGYSAIDGDETVKSPVAFNMDTVGFALYGRGTFTYPERGTYTVTVTATNDVSELIITKEVSIESPVEGLEISLEQELEGTPLTDFLEVNEKLKIITTIVKGDNVLYTFKVGHYEDVQT